MSSRNEDLVGDKFWLDDHDGEPIDYEIKSALERNFFYCEPIKKNNGAKPKVFSEKEIDSYKLLNTIFA